MSVLKENEKEKETRVLAEDEFRMNVLGILKTEGRSMPLKKVIEKANADLQSPSATMLLKHMHRCGWIVMRKRGYWRVFVTIEGRRVYKCFLRLYR